MSLTKFESEVKHIQQNVNIVYERFSDLRNLEALKERINDPAVAAKIAEQVPADKLEEAKKQLEAVTFDRDSIQMTTPVGEIKLCIVERDEPKCIKFESENSPIPLYLWIQLLPVADYETKMRVKAVISALESQIVRELRNGNSVRLGDLGSFRPTLSSKGAASAEDFTSAHIKRVNVRFYGSPNMRFELSKANPSVVFQNEGGDAKEDGENTEA